MTASGAAASASGTGRGPSKGKPGHGLDATRALLLQTKAPGDAAALSAAAAKLQELPLEHEGRLEVDAVRKLLGALRALEGSARATLRGREIEPRLHAHLIIAFAHEWAAARIAAARPPEQATGEAAAAFGDQVERTVRRWLSVAAGHYRSCHDLALVAGGQRPLETGCGDALARVAPGASATPMDSGRDVAKIRSPELEGCIEENNPAGQDDVVVRVTLRTDELGRVVDDIDLEPASAKQAALYGCLVDRIQTWIFPGVGEAEIELPVRLMAPRRSAK